jgi:hypothetical protein
MSFPGQVYNAGVMLSRQARDSMQWKLDRRGALSAARLRALRDQHRGERCVIIGNGPSLNKMDLSPLRDEMTFGLNRIYLLFSEIGFETSYYVSANRLVIEQCAHEIEQLKMPKFLNWNERDLVQFSDSTLFLRNARRSMKFSKDISRVIWHGATVTYTAMQLAYHMGFRQVILIGVDHSFATKGAPNKEVVSAGDDPNHFSGGYFGKGFRWNLPDLTTSEMCYTLAKEAFAADGREILDATVGGKLQVFPKVDFNSLF